MRGEPKASLESFSKAFAVDILMIFVPFIHSIQGYHGSPMLHIPQVHNSTFKSSRQPIWEIEYCQIVFQFFDQLFLNCDF